MTTRFRSLLPPCGCAAVVLWFIAAVVGPAQAQIVHRTVDVLAPSVDEHIIPSLAVDASGCLLVAYRHPSEHALKLAESTCKDFTIGTLYDANDYGRYPSLCIDPAGLISVMHGGSRSLSPMYYTLDGRSGLGGGTVAMFAGYYPAGPVAGVAPSCVVDAEGRPYVAFCAYGRKPYGPSVATFDIPTGTWVVEPLSWLSMPNQGPWLDIAINHQDRPVVAAVTYPGGYQYVSVATSTENGWVTQSAAIESSAMPPGLSLVIDSTDTPCVALRYAGALKLLRFTAVGVTTQTITTTLARIGPASMAIGAGDWIRIAYYDDTDSTVRVASAISGGTWSSVLVDNVTFRDSAGYPAIAIDSRNRWAVGYYDQTTMSVKVAGPGVPPVVLDDQDCDGVSDAIDNCPAVANADQIDTDIDGIGDACDTCTDTDGDGAGDPGFPASTCPLDDCPADPAKVHPGQCGCGNLETDSDGDGTANCLDACPDDPAKIEPGACGCGNVDTDSDGDSVADCIDVCPGTPAHMPVDSVGCPIPPPGDFDADGDVDGADFGVFAGCFNGTGNVASGDCTKADMNTDTYVDGVDYGLFAACFNGSGNPAACE